MPDNTPQNGVANVATDEASYSSDTVHAQIVQLGFVTGTEGAKTLAKAPGDSTDGFKIQINDGKNVTQGITTGAAVTTDTNGTLQQYLRGLVTQVGAVTASPVANTVLDRLKTLATSLTGIAAQLPTALTALGALKTGPSESVITQAVIAGATEPTAGVDLAGCRNLGLEVPSNFDGTSITFKIATALGGTYQELRDITNTVVTLPVTAGKTYDVPGELTFVRFIKIVCDTVQTTSTTTFSWILRS